jgi:acetolactate synthase-1/2/3 large subunit
MIRWKQSIDGLADWGLRFNNPDFPAYARAYGASGRRVGSAAELVPALEDAFTAGGVHLIAASIDYSENVRLRVNED